MTGALPALGRCCAVHRAGSSTTSDGLVELTHGFPFDSDIFGPRATLPLVRIRDRLGRARDLRQCDSIPDDVILRDGDIVVGMDGDFELTVWRRGPAALNQRTCLLRPRPGVDAAVRRVCLAASPVASCNDLTLRKRPSSSCHSCDDARDLSGPCAPLASSSAPSPTTSTRRRLGSTPSSAPASAVNATRLDEREFARSCPMSSVPT